jgi:ABC-type nitrate/sulfonate/bicarbonate transport system ATPase subunit
MRKEQARQIALESLTRLGLAHIANKRNPALSPEERFCVMLLRAAMVKDAMLLIDRPFQIIPHLKNIHYIVDILKIIDDLYLSCHIYDYSWMEDKYGDL